MRHERSGVKRNAAMAGDCGVTMPRLLATTSILAIVIAGAAGLAGTAQAQALPTGGKVTSGSATIGRSGNNLTVNQTSKNAIVSWDSFSVGGGAKAHFENGSGATLNRVTGNVPTSIDGMLTSTGSVYLVNPSGIAVGSGGMVRTGGSFVASTHDTTDADFKNGGDLTLKGNSKASVVNQGTITAKSGDVVLTARRVENGGTISAPNGSAGLVAGYEVLLRDTTLADGKFAVRVGGPDTQAVNSGGIQAADVELRANGGNVQALAGNTSETIKATGIKNEGGRVFLTAGEDGTVEATQEIIARRATEPAKRQVVASLPTTGPLPSKRPDFAGGEVEISGGDIRLGGKITADGNGAAGGKIVAIANDRMDVAGTTRLDASGKTGGFVETSGTDVRIEAGTQVTTLGATGAGLWLIDPTDFTISAGSGAQTTSGIGANTLVANLDTTDVTLQTQSAGAGAGDIFVNAGLSWSSANTLTLTAHNDIHIDGAISASNGGLTLDATGDISASKAVNIGTFTLASGDWVQIASSLPRFQADDFRITGGSFLRAISGDGSGATPYRITDIYGLQGIGTHLSEEFNLARDIDASGTFYWNNGDGFDPIGKDPNQFVGSIKGGGHKITGLFIDRPTENNVGLVGSLGMIGSITGLGIESGNITGMNMVGALVGRNDAGNINGTYAMRTPVSGEVAVGGLVGYSDSTIVQSYAGSQIEGQHYVGGLVGANTVNGIISESYATGDVSGITMIGGLVGNNDGEIAQSYATGAVTGTRFNGGLVGNVSNTGRIDQAYATGAVEGSMDVGALLGGNSGRVSNAYWNTQTSGQSVGVGSGSRAGTSGRTTAQMTNGLLPGFDAMYWGQVAGISFPYLQWRFPTAPTVVSGSVKDLVDGNGRAGIELAVDGLLVGHTSSGANGYYQLMVDPVAAGSAAFALLNGTYADGTASGYGNAISEIATGGGHLTGFDLIDNTVSVNTSIGTMSGIWQMMAKSIYGDETIIPFPYLLDDPNAVVVMPIYCGCGDVDVYYYPGTNVVFDVDAPTLTVDTEMDDSLPPSELTIRGTGNIAFTGNGYVVGDKVTIDAARNLSFAAGSAIDGLGTGDAVRLSAGGTFTNRAGSDLIWLDDPAARWLVYLEDPTAAHTYGNLDSGNKAVWNTEALATVAPSGNRYAFDYQPVLTVTTLDRSKIYGNSINIGGAYSITGVLGSVSGAYIGDTAASAFSGAPTISSTGTARTAGVSDYQITAGVGTLTSSAGYDFALANTGTLSVTPRALMITADDLTRVYGNANPTLTYDIGGLGLVNGDTLTGKLATTATKTSGVGNYAIGQGTLSAGSNYDVTFDAGTLSVGKRAITISADDLSRIYGNANPSLTYDVGGLGLVNGDKLTGSLATSAIKTSDVGTYTIRQGTLSASNNYAVTFDAGTLSVGKRAITISADDLSRIYGNANPALTYDIGGLGLVNGDKLTGNLVTSATKASDIGNYTIRQGTLSAGNNYAVTLDAGTLSVGKRAITVSADDLARIYGNANPALTYNLGGLSLVNGDKITGGLVTSATKTSDVGTYTIRQGTLSAGNNYALSFNAGTLSVGKRAITISADDLSRIYGNSNPALTYDIGGLGLVNGDKITGNLATSATKTSNVGSYIVRQGTLSAGNNYAVTFDVGTLSVGKRAITVSADDLSRIYGNANPSLTYDIGGLGLVNSDKLTGSLGTSATKTSDVGNYAIRQGTLSAGNNYALTFDAGTLSVGKRAITVSADDLSRIYGNANPALTYDIGGLGLVNGDKLTGTLTTSANKTSDVGNYAIRQGALSAGSNYAVTFDAGNLSVGRRAITVSADDLARIYGNANPTLTYDVGGLGLVNGDKITGALTTKATKTSRVGSYAVTQGTLSAGNNYDLAFEAGTLSVDKRAITISADDLTRLYGQNNPPLTYTVGGLGLVNGDTLSGGLETDAIRTSPVGTYGIKQGTLAANSNYRVKFNAGTLGVLGTFLNSDSMDNGSVQTLTFYQSESNPLFVTDNRACKGGVLGPACASEVHPDNR